MSRTQTIGLLERLIEPVASSLNDEAARKLIRLRADRKTKSIVTRLARKCSEGKLTPSERTQYETYVLFGEFVALLQAKARYNLRKHLGNHA